MYKKNKYGNQKTVVDGIKFDSQKEAERYYMLKLMARQGMIKNLERQKKFVLIPKQGKERECVYVADFVYTNKDGETIVEDVKAFDNRSNKYLTTPVFDIKRKLMLYVHGIKISMV